MSGRGSWGGGGGSVVFICVHVKCQRAVTQRKADEREDDVQRRVTRLAEQLSGWGRELLTCGGCAYEPFGGCWAVGGCQWAGSWPWPPW
jgi:hypothetical protein